MVDWVWKIWKHGIIYWLLRHCRKYALIIFIATLLLFGIEVGIRMDHYWLNRSFGFEMRWFLGWVWCTMHRLAKRHGLAGLEAYQLCMTSLFRKREYGCGSLFCENRAYSSRFAFWLFVHGKFLTRDRQPYVSDKTCVLCKYADESASHLFFASMFLRAFGWYSTMARYEDDHGVGNSGP